MRKVGVCLIGAGQVARGHAKSLQQVEEAKLIAISDVNEARGKELAERYGAAYYKDYREMLQRDDVEVAMILTPPNLHPEMAEAAAEAGKHIFCEKPIAATLEGADRVIRAAEKADVKLMVAFCRRFNPVFMEMKRRIVEGEIGEVYYMLCKWETNVAHSLPQIQRTPTNWLFDRRQGGGLIIESNVHFFDLFRWFTGLEVTRVYAEAETFVLEKAFGPHTAEDHVVTLVRMSNNAIGCIDSTWLLQQKTKGLEEEEIIGRKGKTSTREFSEEEFNKARSQSFVNEERHFIKCVLEDKEPSVTGEDGKIALKLALASIESANTGKPITI